MSVRHSMKKFSRMLMYETSVLERGPCLEIYKAMSLDEITKKVNKTEKCPKDLAQEGQ